MEVVTHRSERLRQLLAGRRVVHLKGFGGGIRSAACFDAALAELAALKADAVVWDGDPPKAGGFTELVPRFLAATEATLAVAFKPADAVGEVTAKWSCTAAAHPQRVVVVPVDVPHDPQLRASCAGMPAWAPVYVGLGRAALAATRSTHVIALGGGGVAVREAELSVAARDGVRWSVYAASRGNKERHRGLCDWALEQVGKHDHVMLHRGLDPHEGDAFSAL